MRMASGICVSVAVVGAEELAPLRERSCARRRRKETKLTKVKIRTERFVSISITKDPATSKDVQLLQERKRPPVRLFRDLLRQILVLPLEPHRSEDLAVTTRALLLRAQVDDLLEPFDGVLGAELGCGEGKVVFDVEAGGSVED